VYIVPANAAYVNVPFKQSGVIPVGASVINIGPAIQADEVKLAVTSDPATTGFETEIAVPALAIFESATLAPATATALVPESYGTYALQYTAALVEGASLDRTAASAPVEITVNTFSLDDGNYFGDGIGAPGYALGNKFTFAEGDVIEAVSAALKTPGANAAEKIVFKIYSLDTEANTVTLAYTSEEFDRGASNITNVPVFTQYKLAEPKALAAGTYIVAIAPGEETGANVGIGVDSGEPNGGLYYKIQDETDAVTTDASYGNLLLRPVTQFFTVTPADGSEDVATEAVVSAIFTVPANAELNTTGITLNDETATASVEGKTITVTNPLGSNTDYTVSIPACVVAGYNEAITWSFSTGLATISVVEKLPEGTDVSPDAEVKVIFDKSVNINGASDFTNATIKKGETPVTAPVSVSTDGTEVTFTHDPFDYEGVYTVTIPSGSIVGYEGAITWEFTVTATAIRTADAVTAVYLNKGNLQVTTPAAATVKVQDLAGRTLASYQSTGELNRSLNYANGVYLIVIENGKAISTHKVVLQK
jgi:hypothetical protein